MQHRAEERLHGEMHTRAFRARGHASFSSLPRDARGDRKLPRRERRERNTVARNELEERGAIAAGRRGNERAVAVAIGGYVRRGQGSRGGAAGGVVTPWSVYVLGIRRSSPRPPRPPAALETAVAAAPVLRFSTFSRFILTASSLNRFPGEIYGRAIIQEERARASCTHGSRHVRVVRGRERESERGSRGRGW